MAADPLLAAADRLYGLTLAEFTPARDALVKEHRAPRTLAARAVKALRRPSLAAWVVNLLVRRDAAQVDQVLVVGEALREAQADLDGATSAGLTRQRRRADRGGHGAGARPRRRARPAGHPRGRRPGRGDPAPRRWSTRPPRPAVRTGLLVNPLRSTGVDAVDLHGVRRRCRTSSTSRPAPTSRHRHRPGPARGARPRRRAEEAPPRRVRLEAAAGRGGRGHGGVDPPPRPTWPSRGARPPGAGRDRRAAAPPRRAGDRPTSTSSSRTPAKSLLGAQDVVRRGRGPRPTRRPPSRSSRS